MQVYQIQLKNPNYMNPLIMTPPRNRSKLTKIYHSNLTEENRNLLSAKSNECSNMIVKAKDRYTSKLRKSLDDPSTMPRAYWPNLSNLY